MFILGLTGSIGMGKSTTANFFREAGVPVHDSDAVVHRLYEGEAVAPVEAAFPGVTVDGKIDRAKLAGQLVGKPDAIKQLEAIVHPLVRAVSERFITEARGARRTRHRARHSAAVRNRRRDERRCGRGRLGAAGRAARARAGAARHDRRKARRACWRGRCRTPKSAPARISWWTARARSIPPVHRFMASCALSHRFRGGESAKRRACARSCSTPKPPASIPIRAIGWSRSAASS